MQRQPRPMGSTFLSIEANKFNTEESKEKLLKHIILHYTTSGFMFNGVSCSIPELALLIHTPQNKILELINKTAENLNNLSDLNQIEETVKTIITLGSTWAMQDRGQIQQQLTTMLKAQNGKYKPFISGEVNRSLKLLLDSNKNILDMYKTFFTSTNTTTNIVNMYDKKDYQEQKDYVSPKEALDLVLDQDTKSTLPSNNNKDTVRASGLSDKELDKLYKDHRVGDCPEILEGRSGTEALRALEPLDTSVSKPSSYKAKKPKKKNKAVNSHNNPDIRRAEEYTDYDELPSNNKA